MKDGARSLSFILNPEAKIFNPRKTIAILPEPGMKILSTSCATYTKFNDISFIPIYQSHVPFSVSKVFAPWDRKFHSRFDVHNFASSPTRNVLNLGGKAFSLPSISPNYLLNPCAKSIVPCYTLLKEHCAIIAIFVTLLFLFILFLIQLILINNHDDMFPKDLIKKLKHDNPNKIMIGHLNINSIRSKFEFLKDLIGNNIDVLLISETKLNDSFPPGQFMIDGYHVPFRLDRNDKGGGLLLYFREHIPCKKIIVDFDPLIEAIVIEINLKKRKWLLIGSYNPHKDMIQNHLNSIGGQLNDLCLKYENFILIGDFNSEMCEDAMKVFCSTYNLKNLVNEPTCFKNVDNPSCIDLILTNKSLYFQKTTVIETRISDFHKLIGTTMKFSFQKQEPIIFNYRNYKRFNNDKFRNDLLHEFSKKDFRGISCEKFQFLFMTTLNKHAPMKIRYIRANNSPFMNSDLSKAIMVRSRLRNKFLKLKTNESREAYKKQRNYCVSLLRQVKKNF